MDITLSDDTDEPEDGIALIFSLGSGTLLTFDPSISSLESSSRVGEDDSEKEESGAETVALQPKELEEGDQKEHGGLRGL